MLLFGETILLSLAACCGACSLLCGVGFRFVRLVVFRPKPQAQKVLGEIACKVGPLGTGEGLTEKTMN